MLGRPTDVHSVGKSLNANGTEYIYAAGRSKLLLPNADSGGVGLSAHSSVAGMPE
jgi:hypothetical protein